MRLLLTPGQRGDAVAFGPLTAGLRPGRVVADRAYDSDAIRGAVRPSGAKACIPPSRNRRVRKRYDRRRYKNRNLVERFFGRLKNCRRVATRYDKKPENYLAFCWLAALVTAF